MKTYKQDGYIFITVAVIVTILISTLTIAISNQNKKIQLIENYEQLMTIEEEISAIELVITEYLNNNLDQKQYLVIIFMAFLMLFFVLYADTIISFINFIYSE